MPLQVDPSAAFTQAPFWQSLQGLFSHPVPFVIAAQVPGLHFFLPCFFLHLPFAQAWHAGQVGLQLPDFAASLAFALRRIVDPPNARLPTSRETARRDEVAPTMRVNWSKRRLSIRLPFTPSRSCESRGRPHCGPPVTLSGAGRAVW